ncbi:hypothetical protein [Halorubrum rubrum]|nr:hypothetical protein [Halorubrum rubrum]
MEAERGVSVDVVGDDEAFVGYDAADRTVPADENDDGTIDLVTVENRFAGDVKLEITNVEIGVNPQSGDDGWPMIELAETDREKFKPGSTDVIRGEVHCSEGGGTSQVEVTVTVEATGLVATLFGDTREFEVTCIEPVSEVTFRGSGNADANAGGRTFEAEAWFVEPGDDTDLDDARVEGSFSWDTGKKLKHSFDGNSSGNLVAVYFTETNQTFVHPEYDVDDGELPDSWGTGAGQEIVDGSYQSSSESTGSTEDGNNSNNDDNGDSDNNGNNDDNGD